ncbi:MAG: hypothetical protein E6357_30380 [Clostridiales bacterium]|nr:hypothetical protein [Clostridiales bacterium]
MDGIGGGETLETLRVVIEATTRPYREELDRVRTATAQATDRVERETAKMSKAFSKVGSAIKMALGAVSIGAITSFAKSCIDLGSDLAEVQNVVDVTFGSMSSEVDKFAKNAIAQFGLSELTAKKYMGTYGAMAKAFGMNTQQAYDMSAAITGLTGDVASFYNLSTDESYTKLKSIFTGETESLKDLGVVMTQTALDQYALNNGFGKTTAQMTEQEKVMLRYQFVMAQLGIAQGDFARTSDGWANQTRVLQLRFDQLRATIGQGLINALTPVLKILNGIIERLQVAAQAFTSFTAALFGKSTQQSANPIPKQDIGGGSDLADSTGQAADNTGDIAGNLKDGADQAKKIQLALMGFDQINKLSSPLDDTNTPSGGGTEIPGYDGLDGSVLSDVNKELEDINKNAEKAANAVKNFLKGVKEAAEPTTKALKKLWDEGLSKLANFTWTAIKDFWENFLKPMGKWMLGEQGLPRFLNITNDLLNEIDWKKLNKSLSDLFTELQKPAQFVWTGLMDFYENFLKPLAKWSMNEGLPRFIDATKDMIANINWDLLNEGLKKVWKAIEPFAEGVGEGLVEFYEALTVVGVATMDGIAVAINALGDALGSIDPLTLKELGKDFGILAGSLLALGALTKIIDKLKTFLEAVAGFKFTGLASFDLAGIINGLSTFGILNLSSPAFQKFGNDFWDAISDILESLLPDWLFDFLSNMGAGAAIGFVGGAAIPIVGPIAGAIIGGLIGAIKSVATEKGQQIMDAIFNFDMAKGFVEKMLNNFKQAFDGKNGFIDIGVNIVEGILNGIGAAFSFVLEPVADLFQWIYDSICSAFGIHSPAKKMEPIGNNIILGILEGLKAKLSQVIEFCTALPGKVFDAIGNIKDKVVQKGKDIIDGIKNGYEESKESGLISKVAKAKDDVFSAIGNIKEKVLGKGKNIIEGIKEGYENSKQNGLLSHVTRLKDNVFSSIGNVFDKVTQKGKDIIDGIKDGIDDKKDSLATVVSGIPDLISGGIGNLSNIGKNAIQSFSDGFQSIHIPTPRIDIGWDDWSVGNLTFSVPKFNGISWYARGGFPANGEMFMANEAGPEMIGKMGNRNVVANNKQITQGIKSAVVDGMMEVAAVMGGSSNKGGEAPVIEITLMTDSETFYKLVRKGKQKYENRYEVIATI